MRLHYLQHVPFEGPANFDVWVRKKGHSISGTQMFNNGILPGMEEFDWLVILGGPMNIYEEKKYPWLAREKKFITEAIDSKKIVLGVCLGAQLIADVLGGKVYRNKYTEIGWFPVTLIEEEEKSSVLDSLPDRFTAFHWHGDTFEIPPGSARIAESEGCANQAFEYKERVIGLQFHLEYSMESIKQMLQNCGDEIVEGKYIQKPDEILSQDNQLQELNRIMNLFLDNIEQEFSPRS